MQQLCRNSNNKNGGLFPHEEYCDYYYECDSGTGEALLQACPNGLAFATNKRGLRGNCDYPHRVGCPDGIKTMGQQPITSENCQWQYGVFPHATSCTRYWQCWNGTSTIQQCPFSLLYNDVIHSCDWPDNVPDCQKHRTYETIFFFPVGEKTRKRTPPLLFKYRSSFLSDVSLSLFRCSFSQQKYVAICKDTPNGAVHIDKSCGRYWLCVGGYPRLQRCPAGLAFNPVNQRCELAQTVPGW